MMDTPVTEVIHKRRSIRKYKPEQICGAVALGYADQVYASPFKRTGNAVTIVR